MAKKLDNLPVMIDGNNLVYIKLKDKPAVGIVCICIKGAGMSTMMYRLIDYAYWKCRYKVGIFTEKEDDNLLGCFKK